MMMIYWPTWRAGFVSDTTGWLYDIQNSSFLDYINRSNFKVKSLYQFTQLVTWFFYQLFGTRHICWHLLSISFHSANIVLLYQIFSKILNKSNASSAQIPILSALLLFILSPTVSEVVVWEASFHYLLGLMLILLIIKLLQLYFEQGNGLLLVLINTLFFLSSFSIEVFYLTPFLVPSYILFEKKMGMANQGYITKSFKYGILPMLGILLFHFALVKITFGPWIPHNTDGLWNNIECKELISKVFKILGHVFLLVRFYPQEAREAFYHFCNQYYLLLGISLTALFSVIFWRYFRGEKAIHKTAFTLILFWFICFLALVIPLWFPTDFWVAYDRYQYFWMPFGFLLLFWVAQRLLPVRFYFALTAIYLSANGFALYKVNKKWQQSAQLSHQLMNSLPDNCNKKVVLLNSPQCFNGIWMLPANPQNEVQTIKSCLYPEKGAYPIKEVYSYNILSTEDGAHVKVLNDSTLRVELNQWGTWWWYDDLGAVSYQNDWYTAKLDEYGYTLELKGDRNEYLILFQKGARWNNVNWSIKNEPQY